jgi:glycerol-3-phosphate cytidylyltransferase
VRVYTGGTFDLFHIGHVRLLLRCRGLAGPDGKVIVSLNTDAFVQQYKGRPPVIPYEQRREVLEACRYVDQVVANVGGADSKPALQAAWPIDYIVVGSDWKHRDYLAQLDVTPEWLGERGIQVIYVPYTDTISSSWIRQAIA